MWGGGGIIIHFPFFLAPRFLLLLVLCLASSFPFLLSLFCFFFFYFCFVLSSYSSSPLLILPSRFLSPISFCLVLYVFLQLPFRSFLSSPFLSCFPSLSFRWVSLLLFPFLFLVVTLIFFRSGFFPFFHLFRSYFFVFLLSCFLLFVCRSFSFLISVPSLSSASACSSFGFGHSSCFRLSSFAFLLSFCLFSFLFLSVSYSRPLSLSFSFSSFLSFSILSLSLPLTILFPLLTLFPPFSVTASWLPFPWGGGGGGGLFGSPILLLNLFCVFRGGIFSSLVCLSSLFAALPYHFALLLGGCAPIIFSFGYLLFLSSFHLLLAYANLSAPSSSFPSAFGSSPPGLPLPHLQLCLSPPLSSSASIFLGFRLMGSFSSSFIFLLGFGGCTRVGWGSSFVFWGPLLHYNHPLLPRLALLSWRLVADCFRFSLLLLLPLSLLSQSALSSSSLWTSPVVAAASISFSGSFLRMPAVLSRFLAPRLLSLSLSPLLLRCACASSFWLCSLLSPSLQFPTRPFLLRSLPL